MYLWCNFKNIKTSRFADVSSFLDFDFYMELKEIKFDFLQ